MHDEAIQDSPPRGPGTDEDERFALVTIPRSGCDELTYRIPGAVRDLLRVGARVRVPLRSRMVTGLVVGLFGRESLGELDPAAVRPVEELLDLEPVLDIRLLELARFIASYYRCPLGDTLTAMLPARMLRSDSEEVELTQRGAAAGAAGAAGAAALTPLQTAIMVRLAEHGRTKTASLLAAAGARTRSPLEALETAGMIRIRRRRARPPQAEVTAVALPSQPLEELLEAVSRAPRRQEVLRWLADEERPALVRDVCTAVGCSEGVVRGLIRDGLLRSFKQAPETRPRWRLPASTAPIVLTDEQQVAVDAVIRAIQDREFAPILLDGVTGSGKTEVYLRCLDAALASGRSGLVLVPEIGLTPAAVGAVERRFGSRVALLHSALGESERWRQWQAIRDGGARVVVGPRSALFAPLEQVGLIVVDEEHDGAYKQQEAPRYNARDLALVMGQRCRVPVLMCSATPSTEATALVERGMARRLALTRRVSGGGLPEVELVDLRHEPPEPGEQGRTLFSRRLVAELTGVLERGEQAMLLMQRRGWAPVLQCRDCGHRLSCDSCSVALVVHRRSHDLRCHYCGLRRPFPDSCPSCNGTLLNAMGAGTEKVAHYLHRHFPEVATGILDRDTTRRRSGLEQTLGAFEAGRLQVLVGTQMIAKGHHFPNVTLTGVISADAMLGMPDYRAGERTFQLLTQVAGRAGRGERPGRVIIQTYYPDHPAVRHACHHDSAAFLADELVMRRAFSYPPATRMALVRYESKQADAARDTATRAVAELGTLPEDVRLRGPAPAPLERIRERWRWQVLICAANRGSLRRVLEGLESVRTPADVRRIIDVDPMSTL